MKTLFSKLLIVFCVVFFACNNATQQPPVTDTTIADTAKQQTADTTQQNLSDGKLTVKPLDVAGNQGQITFTINDKTVFYFDYKTQSGSIEVNSKVYKLSKINSKNDTVSSYTINGDGISIAIPKCVFKENEGTDCFYGTAEKATITVGSESMTLNNITVQDCPNNN